MASETTYIERDWIIKTKTAKKALILVEAFKDAGFKIKSEPAKNGNFFMVSGSLDDVKIYLSPKDEMMDNESPNGVG